jgi:hypothetical protein
MRWFSKIPQWVLVVISLVVFFLIVALVGEIYRRFRVLWVCLWLGLPVVAYIVSSGTLDAHLTEKGFKSLRVWLLIFAVGMSFVVLFDRDLKEIFGHHFIKGSKFWYADYGDTDDYGNPVATHEYYAPTAWGRFVLGAYEWVKIGLCILLPTILYWSFERSLRTKEQERYEQERLK